MLAVRNGDVYQVEAALIAGADPQCLTEDVDIVDLLVEVDPWDWGGVWHNFEPHMLTPLTVATMRGHIEVMKVLIRAGALRTSAKFEKNISYHNLAMHVAVAQGNQAAAEVLLQGGMDPYAPVLRLTPVDTACSVKNVGMLQWLLHTVGLTVHSLQREYERTPLAFALDDLNPSTDIVRTLLAAGASVHGGAGAIEDQEPPSVLECANGKVQSPAVYLALMCSEPHIAPTDAWMQYLHTVVKNAPPRVLFDILRSRQKLHPYHITQLQAMERAIRQQYPGHADALRASMSWHTRRGAVLHRRQTRDRARARQAARRQPKRGRSAAGGAVEGGPSQYPRRGPDDTAPGGAAAGAQGGSTVWE